MFLTILIFREKKNLKILKNIKKKVLGRLRSCSWLGGGKQFFRGPDARQHLDHIYSHSIVSRNENSSKCHIYSSNWMKLVVFPNGISLVVFHERLEQGLSTFKYKPRAANLSGGSLTSQPSVSHFRTQCRIFTKAVKSPRLRRNPHFSNFLQFWFLRILLKSLFFNVLISMVL